MLPSNREHGHATQLKSLVYDTHLQVVLEHFAAVQEGGTGLAQVTQIHLKEIKTGRNLIKAQTPSIHYHCWKLENPNTAHIYCDQKGSMQSLNFPVFS